MIRSGKVTRRLFLALLLITPSMVYAWTIEDLITHPLVSDVKISPDAKTLAVRMFHEGSYALLFMDRDTLKVVGGFNPAATLDVGDYHWVNHERVVGELLRFQGSDRPGYYGELFGVNFDGTQGELLFGIGSGQMQTGSHIRKRDPDRAWADIVDVLPDDPDHILISSTEMSSARDRRPKAELLNVYTGLQKPLLVAPRFGLGRFFTDRHGVLRVMSSLKRDETIHLETLPDGAEEWIELPATIHGDYFNPVAISDDNRHVMVLDNTDGDRVGLYKLAMDGSAYSLMYGHDRVDVTEALMSTDERSIYGVRVDDGYPSYLFFADAHKEADIFKSLLQAFSGHLVSIRSKSDDGRYWIVKTGNDRDEGSFYLFDRESHEVRFLIASRPGIEAGTLARMAPIEFPSFDGTAIAGYFTPATVTGDDERIPPMVVLVHGGPRARDYWGYDGLVQVLAGHGYSVLQINYRGSTGYGKVFERLGNREWGRNIQKDIIAGTRWAVAEGRADKDRICIMGGSFGAYSAVQSSILAPDLYRCAVANAGIYDLKLMYTDGDIETLYFGDAYLEQAIGRDEEILERYSPVYRAAELQAPVFIAHGKQDERAPYKHAKALRKALKKHDKEYEWFVKGREEHGFYDHANRAEYLKAALEFLDKYLK